MNENRSFDLGALCDEYEKRTEADLGPASVNEFLTAHPHLQCDQRSELLLELVCADVELLWMRWAHFLESQIESADLTMLLDRFQSLPSLNDYLPILERFVPDAASLRNAIQEIAQSELQTRHRYGDAIGQPFFAHHHGLDLVDNLASVFVEIRSDKRAGGKFAIRGCTIFGRKKHPSDPSLVRRKWGNRMVIADWFESTVSRVQLSVQLLSPKYAVVTNLSKMNPIDVSSRGQLSFGQPRFVKLPFTVRCGPEKRGWSKRLVVEGALA